MAKKIEDTIKFVKNADNLMSFGKSFATLNGQPLDKDSIFDKLADAEAFAKTPSAYVGKILVVVENNVVTAYVIDHNNTLKPIGDKATMDNLAADLQALSAKEAEDVKALQAKDTALDGEVTALKEKDKAIDVKDAAQDKTLEAHGADITALKEKDKTIDQTISSLDAAYKAADTEINKTITALDAAYKDADSKLDTRLQAAEGKLENVSNVMDFRGAVKAKPASISGYQKGDVIVVTEGDDAGKEFVCDGAAWVEFGNSNAEQAAISALQTKTTQLEANKEDKTVVAAIDGRLKVAEGEIDTLQKDSATKVELGETNKAVTKNTEDITALTQTHSTDKAALEKSIEGVSTTLTKKITDLDTTITGVGADSTLTALGQTDGKLTATAAKIQIAESQVTNLTKDLESKVDKDPNARLMTKTEGTQLSTLVGLQPAEAGAQVNKIETIKIDNEALAITSPKTVTLPAAMANKLGLVKGNAVENGIEVNNGLMSVHSLNVNKLTQTAGDTLVLNGGDAGVKKTA